MRKVNLLLVSGLLVGSCFLSALPALADTATASTPPNAGYIAQIKQLRQQDKSLYDQLQGLRKSIVEQRKVDWQQKNYTALLNAKNDQIAMENDFNTAYADRLTLRKDDIQLHIDRQAKNKQGVAADLQSIITDLQNQIGARQQLITDAQKILADLGGNAGVTAGGTGASTTSSGMPSVSQNQ
ncbi:hypothetical protein [Desulfotomaculum copahuensis]|uniref:Uncharacterized protein n=1 Tax=Desulfotomaculum copahuensis TaxID=1838280 RepID=A0A1B7LFI9_9FIRM|nr:hypothetical protein [Desulfotomaculum copahuensis]OAT82925.1 hypothetical protein A6M21_08505 [Desulfotomaculum copahuensis]